VQVLAVPAQAAPLLLGEFKVAVGVVDTDVIDRSFRVAVLAAGGAHGDDVGRLGRDRHAARSAGDAQVDRV